MVYYGDGFSWTELYEMPVWLRKFYYKKMEEAMLKKKEAATNPVKKNSKPKIDRPSIGPR